MSGQKQQWVRGLPVLGVIWLLGAIVDRLWFTYDRAIPAWDQAEYLTGALNYWRALHHPQWLSGAWWVGFWQLSSKIPPLVYISTAPFLALFGRGIEQSTLVNLLFSAILLASVYSLGTFLFSRSVGLWAAGLCLLLPGLYRVRLDFLMDYPLAALVTLSFFCLTVFWGKKPAPSPSVNAQELPSEPVPEATIAPAAVPPLSPAEATVEPATEAVMATEVATLTAAKPEIASEPAPGVAGMPQSSEPVALERPRLAGWLWAIAFGFSFGLALMVKQPALLFLLVPLLAVGVGIVRQRAWLRLVQLLTGLGVALLVCWPWYRTNWLTILTAGKRATVDSAIAEADPPLTSLLAWTYYLQKLPELVFWPLLVLGLVGLLFYWKRVIRLEEPVGPITGLRSRHYRHQVYGRFHRSWIWLLTFLLGAYFLSSLNINKDDRYFLPALPVLAVLLAQGLLVWPGRWPVVRWGAVSLSCVWMALNLLPVSLIRPQHPAYVGAEWSHAQVIAEVRQASPHLVSTIGVLPSTPQVNQHNLNYFGALKDFQVYGRQVGANAKQVSQDSRSLPWYVTKTGPQGAIRRQTAQTALTQAIEQGDDFRLQKTWPLPDGTTLKLYRRTIPLLEAQPLVGLQRQRVQLDQVIMPEQAPPGKPIPVTYKWSGPWEALRSGLVILTWKRQAALTSPTTPVTSTAPALPPPPALPLVPPATRPRALALPFPPAAPTLNNSRWFHDHGIGMGFLHPGAGVQASAYQVVERTAMLPPTTTVPGFYGLEAVYLNRKTGETYPLATPNLRLKLDPAVAATPAPELDWVTRLCRLAIELPQGPAALETVFDQVGQMNQYDPLQDYLLQAQQALAYRLRSEPQNLPLAYGLALTHVLKRQVEPAIATFQKITQMDSRNPYAYGYLAFVNLYDFRAGAAQAALRTALKLKPNSPELQGLSGVAALMGGNLIQAWQYGQAFQASQKASKQP